MKSMEVKIKKKTGSFTLDLHFASDAKRIGILGSSGAGKSMLLKLIAGIEHPDQGYIRIGGSVFCDTALRLSQKPQQRRVGYLFQNYALFPAMTVEENIAAGLRGGKKACALRTEEMIQRFRLSGLEHRLPRQLSGGQQQRVALARIMACRPDMILLDEPFSALDSYLKDQMQEELFSFLSDYPGIVILVSHAREEIYRFSEEVLILDRGRLVEQGNTEEIFEHPNTKTAALLTGCRNFSKAFQVDAHTVDAPDWGVRLQLKRVVPDHLAAVGCHAHRIVPIWGKKTDNCIRFQCISKAELPFEQTFFCRPETGACGAAIRWQVDPGVRNMLEERGMPDYLQFDESALLLLEKGGGHDEEGNGEGGA